MELLIGFILLMVIATFWRAAVRALAVLVIGGLILASAGYAGLQAIQQHDHACAVHTC